MHLSTVPVKDVDETTIHIGSCINHDLITTKDNHSPTELETYIEFELFLTLFDYCSL